MPFSGDGLHRVSSFGELKESKRDRESQLPDTPGRRQAYLNLRSRLGYGEKLPPTPMEKWLVGAVLFYAGLVFMGALLFVWYMVSEYKART